MTIAFNPIVKLGLLGGGALVGATTVSLMVFGFTPDEKAFFLSEDEEFNKRHSNKYENGWGKKYARYLLSAEANKNWWKDKYKKISEAEAANKPSKGRFKSVDHATKGENSLSKVCDEAYRTASTNVEEDPNDDTKFKEADIWKYCSPSGTKIETITAADGYSTQGTYGQKSEYQSLLVSAKDTDKNVWFWKLKQEELKATNFGAVNPKSQFQILKFSLTNPSTTGTKTVRQVCEEAYKKQEADENYIKKEVFQFCSLTGKEPVSNQNPAQKSP